MSRFEETHDTFKDRIINSRFCPWLYAMYLWDKNRGLKFHIPPLKVAHKRSQAMANLDDGNLFVTDVEEGRTFRLEIKYRPTLEFTSAADYPYSTVFICNTRSFDRAKHHIATYIIFNRDLTHFISVPVSTFDQWEVQKDVVDRDYGADNKHHNYVIKPEHCGFHTFDMPDLFPRQARIKEQKKSEEPLFSDPPQPPPVRQQSLFPDAPGIHPQPF